MMINAIENNLQKGIFLLENISDFEYSNTSIPPYFSSIGSHIRHILDVFSCILNGIDKGIIDLTHRERNELIEQKTNLGIEYCNEIIERLKAIPEQDLQQHVKVIDNLGLGNVTVTTSIAAVLMQAQSHAIHHYASVGYVIHQLGIELPDNNFGLNPTTPKKENTLFS